MALPIPLPGASGRWRKKKKVASVSEDIKLAVQETRLLHAQANGLQQALVREAPACNTATPNQADIAVLFRVINRSVGNLPSMLASFPITLRRSNLSKRSEAWAKNAESLGKLMTSWAKDWTFIFSMITCRCAFVRSLLSSSRAACLFVFASNDDLINLPLTWGQR